MEILDSGNRREFESGAVRDMAEGKGRCDLMPLDVVAEIMGDDVINCIAEFKADGNIDHLCCALNIFAEGMQAGMILEVSKHFEEGHKKYPPGDDGVPNWQKGIPVHSYIDSAVRHYLKFMRGDKDEPHGRAFVWNILCCIWTCKHLPAMNDFSLKVE